MKSFKNDKELYLASLQVVFPRLYGPNPDDARDDGASVKAIRVLNQDGTQSMRLHVVVNGELKRPLEFKMDELRTKISKVQNYGVQFSGIEIQAMIFNLRNLPDGAILNDANRIGWQLDTEEHYTGWVGATCLDMQGNQVPKDIYKQFPTSSGDFEENIAYLKSYLSKHEFAQTVFMCGMSAVLAGYMRKNLLLNLASKSSRGKTTLGKLIISLFAEPTNEKLCKTFNATLNKLAENLDGLFGTAVLIDDLSLAPDGVKKSLDNMIYLLKDGKEKGRKRRSVYDPAPTRWNTTILMTSEESILEKCNPETEGSVGRFMEPSIQPDDIFSDADECNQLVAHFNQNYGLIATAFVYHLLTSDTLQKLPELHQKEVDRLRASYSSVLAADKETAPLADVVARMEEDVAIVTLTGQLINQFFQYSLDTDKTAACLINSTTDVLESFKASQKENIILKTIYPALLEYGSTVCKEYNQQEGRVLIPSQALKTKFADIQCELGYKPIQIKRALKEAGVLVVNDGAGSFTATISGKSFRGICLLVKKELFIHE